ncbi:hypothetical protein [Stenotrophomonas sp.]|uniref:hypothetical protein n=1 Tax=Stenotrophomonas sp. TaxID=69392 RepID=UPI0019B8BCFF|nr:hypothetical protein [Stenotrophomonas sp.]MBD3825636.1 hypothetical protein [Stenotrophomonas sp.]
MGEIKLNREDSMRILNSTDASPDARVIAAFAVMFFEAVEHADELDAETYAIAHKLLRMGASELDHAREQANG